MSRVCVFIWLPVAWCDVRIASGEMAEGEKRKLEKEREREKQHKTPIGKLLLFHALANDCVPPRQLYFSSFLPLAEIWAP